MVGPLPHHKALAALFLVALCLPVSMLQAAVSAQLSSSTIGELETVRLSIRSSNTRSPENLDLTALEADFEVLGTNYSSQYRFINGREQKWVDYQINLQPKRTGTLQIPSIKVGDDATPDLTLTVQALSDATRQVIDEKVFFQQDVSADEVYVQSQLLVERRLLYSEGVQLYSDIPGAPEIEDAVVLTLGEPTSSTTQYNGRRYGVVTQRFAIFPESSGALTVPAISVTASVRLIEDGRVSRKGVRVATSETQVKVLPVPADYPADKPWLPATDVQLQQVITPASGNRQAPYQVGDTLTHELLVFLHGNVGSIAPPVPLLLDDDAARVYPGNPVVEDDNRTDSVYGSRLQTSEILLRKPGTFEVGATEITWWDTANKQVRTTTWPATSVTIEGEIVSDTASPAPSEQAPTSITDSPGDTPTEANTRWVWLPAALGVLAILLWFVWQRSAALRDSLRAKRHTPAVQREVLLQEVMQNIQNGTPDTLLNKLTQWAHSQFDQPGPLALSQLTKTHPELKSPLDRLQAICYQAQSEQYLSDIDRATLSETLVQYRRKSAVTRILQSMQSLLPTDTADTNADNRLPPLYPHKIR